ncbi:MAG: deoxynucleoside kinase [Chloroflexi bacterium]|nr:deoxynucleoside kinase [Chloroflexota bacterium]
MVKRYIVVAGNIGVGKSTLTRLIAEALGWQPFFEPSEINPYLSDFYGDMPRWAFPSQVFFLARRLRHHRRIAQHPTTVLQDRSVYEDAEIFAKNLFRQGQMTERDYLCYRELYEVLLEFLPAPDLVIYLRADVDTLLARIAQRGRDYERQIPRAYLETLNQLYEEWTASFTFCPMLTVPAHSLDFVQHPRHLQLIIERVQDKLQGKDEVSFD